MVLDLEVQPADEPAKQPVPVGKIHSCFDLMHRPGGFHPSGVWPGQRKSRVLHTMPQLKYHAKHLALHERRYHPKQEHDPNGVQRQGDRECQREENHFAPDEDRQVPTPRPRQPVPAGPAGKHVPEVVVDLPLDR